ncbi:TPA_asm: L [Schiedea betacytorhabdovirus 1]|nr:TPA_asm: L [Schiedea betacytorhabdovirus 1]
MDDLDLTEVFSSKPMRGLGDFHLRSALVFVDTVGLQQNKGRHRERRSFQSIIKHFPGYSPQPGVPSILMEEVFSARGGIPRDLTEIREELIMLLEAEFKGLELLRYGGDVFSRIITILGESTMTSEYSDIKDITIKAMLNSMAMTSQREIPEMDEIRIIDRDCRRCVIGSVVIFLFGELFCKIDDRSKICYVYNLDHLRMICDKVTERDNVLISAQIGHLLFPEIYPSEDVIKELFLILDHYLIERGNSGYSVVKVYEALATAAIISRDSGNYWPNDMFLKGTLEGLSEEDLKIAMTLFDFFQKKSQSVHHITQFMGLFRLWGHPVIDGKAGIKKARNIGIKDKIIDQYTSEVSGWKFLEIFCTNYYKKEGRYPPTRIKPNSPSSYLIDQLLSSSQLNLKNPEYSLSDWESISLDQTFDVPTSFNLSMIVADTAISPTRSELKRSSEAGNAGLDPVQRRGVLKWMKDGVLECKPLLESVQNTETGVEKDNLLIGLYPKEREQNEKPRMFALMPLVTRSIVVITEHMLADHIIPFIPGVTMTHSMLKLQKEMIKLTSRQAKMKGASMSFCVNMDFEKWNLNMRQEATRPVFSHLGNLFGLSELYNRTYDIFRNSIIYLADGTYILKLDDNLDLVEQDPDLAYEGHKGGFEGLRQKGWTIFTVCLISYICDSLGVDWKLMGQGDNQVLLVTVHSTAARSLGLSSLISQEEIKKKLRQVISSLKETFDMVSLPLKLLETWVSENFFSYGKVPIYKGVPCSSSLKRISRVFFFSNEDLMTIDNALGAVSSNAQAAAMTDPLPVIPYVIAKYQHLLCADLFVKYNPLVGGPSIHFETPAEFRMYDRDSKESVLFKSDRIIDIDIIRVLMVSLPKTIGGYNVLSFFEMISRGFSDPPNRDYQFFTMLTDNIQSPRLKPFFLNCCDLILNDKINYSYLVRDPTGLNLLVPTNSTAAIREMIQRTIKGLNFDSDFSEWFQELLSVCDPDLIVPLCNKLVAGDSVNVRFVHDILGATIFGYGDAIASKIDKTVTLSRIALGQEKVVNRLVSNEKRFISYFVWRIQHQGVGYDWVCPSRYIRQIRAEGWGKQVIGVDVPYPYHYLTRVIENTDRPDSYVEVLTSDYALESEGFTLTHVGGALPYLGSVTQEKVMLSPVRAAFGSEPLISRPLRLLRAIGWFVDEDSNFGNLLKDLVRAVSDLDPDHLVYIPDDVKGSMIHRYSDFATKHGSLWLPLYGPCTFLNLSTNHFLEFSKGSKNVNMHFQALLCLIQFSAVSSMLSDDGRKYLKFFRSCDQCITPIVEEFEDLPNRVLDEEIPSRPLNPYLFLREHDISLVTRSRLQDIRGIQRITLDWLDDDHRYSVVLNWASMRMFNELYSSSQESGEDILDVAGTDRTFYLRIYPFDLIRSLFRNLWVSVASEDKHCLQRYPVFESVKEDLLRILERIPPNGYSFFSGYYLWPETLEELERMGAVFPMSYPASPSSVAVASKGTIIKAIKSLNENQMNPPPYVVIGGFESDLLLQLKWICCREKNGFKECEYCVMTVLQIRASQRITISELMLLRCKKQHNVLSFSNLFKIKYLGNAPINTISDGIKPVPYTKKVGKVEILARRQDVRFDLHDILAFSEVIDWTYDDITVPSVTFQKFSRSKTGDLHAYSLPTDSMYSATEGLSSARIDGKRGILVLGDGYGYSSCATRMMYPRANIIGWSLIDISEGVSHAGSSSLPPSHYYLNPKINLDPTFTQISDIGNPSWSIGFQEVVQKYAINSILCEVEFWYTGEDYTTKIIEEASKNQVYVISVKYRLSTLKDLIDAINTLSNWYHYWFIREGIIENIRYGSCWLIGEKPRKERSIMKIGVKSITMISSIVANPYDRSTTGTGVSEAKVDELTAFMREIPEFKNLLEIQINQWFSEAELGGWNSNDMTPLLNKLRTGRRPVQVADMTGSNIYYLHKEHEYRIVLRLLALAFGMAEEWSSSVIKLEDRWSLVWERKESGRWGLKLAVRSNGQTLKYQDQEIIMRYAKNIREVRKELSNFDRGDGEEVGDEVEFSYVRKRSKKTKWVIFPVSKISSYR